MCSDYRLCSILPIPLTSIDSDLFGYCPQNAPPNCTRGPKWTPNGLSLFRSQSINFSHLERRHRSTVLSPPRSMSRHKSYERKSANASCRWSISYGMTGNASARRTSGRTMVEPLVLTPPLASTLSSLTVDLPSSMCVSLSHMAIPTDISLIPVRHRRSR